MKHIKRISLCLMLALLLSACDGDKKETPIPVTGVTQNGGTPCPKNINGGYTCE